MKLMGEIDSRKSASFSGSPYSAARSGLRHGAVRAKNVLKLAMPTMSTAAAHFRSAQNVMAASVMNPPYEPPITPIRSAGATPDSASHPAAASRSRTESMRRRTSSSDMYPRPYPLEPRTFGWSTLNPAPTSATVSGFQSGRA